MHSFIKEIKDNESKPFVVKNFLNNQEVQLFQNLYIDLPIEINNTRQRIIKKKWSIKYNLELQEIYEKKLQSVIGEFEMDNPKTKDGLKSLGLYQESFLPVNVHVDTGFNFEKKLFKQTLLPLSNHGDTIIFKNRFYGCSTTFTINPIELAANGYNKRSSEHLKLYGGKDFDKKIHKNYLSHEEIDNLKGLEIDLIYHWELGDLLVFDRTSLHCSSDNIKGKKLGFTTSTAKL